MRLFWITLLSATALFAVDPGQRAPGFSLPDLKGAQHDLADFRGKPLIVEFMQTTCPHCATFTGILQKLQQKYGAQVGILAIVNPPDDQNKVAAYISGHKVTYPILFDCGQAAYSYLRITTFDLPQVYLVDGDGIVRKHFDYGPMTRDIFEGNGLMPEVDRLLGGARPVPQKK